MGSDVRSDAGVTRGSGSDARSDAVSDAGDGVTRSDGVPYVA